MQIKQSILEEINPKTKVSIPAQASFDLPEKVLQFGTGVLLRGLPDYFIDKANKKGIFNGRVVVVKSTDRGSLAPFEEQDSMYTICVRGLQNGETITEFHLNNAISKVLKATRQWEEILKLAASEELEVIISNTTEVGIQLVEDDLQGTPPDSFPGKLLAFLLARYNAFDGDPSKGLVIVPTELIIDNGTTLKNILIKKAEKNKLDAGFIQWLSASNTYCNTLVDRIVPGKLRPEEQEEVEKQLGYEDKLLIATEPYRLWAIEIPEKARRVLSFSEADSRVILTDDIRKYRELKLRLLNATHTFSCALSYLSGINTVRESMQDEQMSTFIEELMLKEIAPAITGDIIAPEEAEAFARDVMDRFKNPFIIHKWLSISFQYSLKVRTRLVPLLKEYVSRFDKVPLRMAKGLAAYLLFMKTEESEKGYQGTFRGETYTLTDDKADKLHAWWQKEPENPARAILSDESLWGMDLTKLSGLAEEVEKQLQELKEKTAE